MYVLIVCPVFYFVGVISLYKLHIICLSQHILARVIIGLLLSPPPLPTSLRNKKIFFAYTDLYFHIMHAVSYSCIRASFFCNANVCRPRTQQIMFPSNLSVTNTVLHQLSVCRSCNTVTHIITFKLSGFCTI